MAEEKKTGRALERPVRHTGKFYLAAALDALGWSRKDIAEKVGAAEESVSRWRADEAYLAERDKHIAVIRGDLLKLREVAIVRTDVAALKAQEWAIQNLAAVDADNNPLYQVQIRAAEILVKLALAGVLSAGKGEVVGGGEEAGHAGGIVHIHLGENARVERVELQEADVEGTVTSEEDGDDTDRDGD